jgi:hypothetical protein
LFFLSVNGKEQEDGEGKKIKYKLQKITHTKHTHIYICTCVRALGIYILVREIGPTDKCLLVPKRPNPTGATVPVYNPTTGESYMCLYVCVCA